MSLSTQFPLHIPSERSSAYKSNKGMLSLRSSDCEVSAKCFTCCSRQGENFLERTKIQNKSLTLRGLLWEFSETPKWERSRRKRTEAQAMACLFERSSIDTPDRLSLISGPHLLALLSIIFIYISLFSSLSSSFGQIYSHVQYTLHSVQSMDKKCNHAHWFRHRVSAEWLRIP